MRLIYCHGRSGSTQLFRCMRRYRDLNGKLYEEPFKQKNAERHGFPENIRNDDNFKKYIKFLDANCIKHLWSDLPEHLNRCLIGHPSIKVIVFLYRRNFADYAMSMVTASLTKEWHGATAEFYGEIPIDRLIKSADNIVNAVPRNAELIKENASSPIVCASYEDLYGFNGNEIQRDTADAIMRSLGVNDSEFISNAIQEYLSMGKKYKGADYYAKIFTNYAEAMDALSRAAPPNAIDGVPELIIGKSEFPGRIAAEST